MSSKQHRAGQLRRVDHQRLLGLVELDHRTQHLGEFHRPAHVLDRRAFLSTVRPLAASSEAAIIFRAAFLAPCTRPCPAACCRLVRGNGSQDRWSWDGSSCRWGPGAAQRPGAARPVPGKRPSSVHSPIDTGPVFHRPFHLRTIYAVRPRAGRSAAGRPRRRSAGSARPPRRAAAAAEAGPAGPSPSRRGQPVAHVLLVERRLAAAWLPAVQQARTGTSRGQHLVGQQQRAVRGAAQLDLGVGHDDPRPAASSAPRR